MYAYILSPEELQAIANLCLQEQGTLDGIKAEASLAANLLETSPKYSKKYGHDIYNFMRNSGWFSRAAYWMDHGNAGDSQIVAVYDVLINGNRTLPQYIVEHDCLGDIISVKNNGVAFNKMDRSQYVKDVTVIQNVYGSVYTFYSFPNPHGDPFGYISKPKEEENAFYIEIE